MALRKRLSKNREKDIPEEEGGRRHKNRHNDDNDYVEVEKNDNDLDDNHNKDETENSKDDNKAKSKDVGNDVEKDDKSEGTGKSFASRNRRKKKGTEEKPSEDEPKPTKNRFGRMDKDSESGGKDENATKGTHDKLGENDDENDNHESNSRQESNRLEKDLEMGPLRILEPIRTDPVLLLKSRKKKLDRLTADFVPEVHIIGSILSGTGILQEASEGATCRWKVDGGSGWEHLGGDLFGQTQVAYPAFNMKETVPFNHPIDLHFAEPGIQSWGSPRLMLQCYRLDVHGRRILAGYGFIHLPTTTGRHLLEVNMWRPTGTSSEEMDSSYLGRMPSLITHEPIYDSAWDERCRLVTVPTGSVFLDLYVMTRFMNKHNTDVK